MNDHRLIVGPAVARDLREMFGGDFDLMFIESPAIPDMLTHMPTSALLACGHAITRTRATISR